MALSRLRVAVRRAARTAGSSCVGAAAAARRTALAGAAAASAVPRRALSVSTAARAAAAPQQCEYLVIGGGIAGASTAYYLSQALQRPDAARVVGAGGAASASVVLLERESQPAMHSTGRSAALYSETYGNEVIRALTTGSRAAYYSPPPGFAEHRLLAPRGCLYIGTAAQRALLDGVYRDGSKLVSTLRRLTGAEVTALCPVVRPEYAVDGAVLEPDAEDIDVAAVQSGFLKGAKRWGTRVVCDAEVTAIASANASASGAARPGNGGWVVTTASGAQYRARVIVNAAGAWADRIGAMAGALPIGLQPKRRTIIVFKAPEQYSTAAVNKWPFVMDCDEQFYFKPDAGQIWGSPADQTPTDPCDAQPDDFDMAVAIDRLQTATTLPITRLTNKWAGLRSFVADKSPVVGADPRVDGFVWVAAQGGYGIQTCFAMGELSAAFARGLPVPHHLHALGVTADALRPDRPGIGPHATAKANAEDAAKADA